MELVELDFNNELLCGDQVLCPYCGGNVAFDTCDFECNESNFECEDCGLEFEATVEWSPSITTYRYNGRVGGSPRFVVPNEEHVLCRMCGDEITGVREAGFPVPVFRCPICDANVCKKCDDNRVPCCDEYRFWLEHRGERED